MSWILVSQTFSYQTQRSLTEDISDSDLCGDSSRPARSQLCSFLKLPERCRQESFPATDNPGQLSPRGGPRRPSSSADSCPQLQGKISLCRDTTGQAEGQAAPEDRGPGRIRGCPIFSVSCRGSSREHEGTSREGPSRSSRKVKSFQNK